MQIKTFGRYLCFIVPPEFNTDVLENCVIFLSFRVGGIYSYVMNYVSDSVYRYTYAFIENIYMYYTYIHYTRTREIH